MIATILLALQAAPPPPMPPQDWGTLPTLRYVRPANDDAALASFVRGEVQAGRCAAARATPNGWTASVDVAVLVQPDGIVRRTTPRAIGCPSVEQYAAGIVFSRARMNIDTTGIVTDGWYRTTLTFAWR